MRRIQMRQYCCGSSVSKVLLCSCILFIGFAIDAEAGTFYKDGVNDDQNRFDQSANNQSQQSQDNNRVIKGKIVDEHGVTVPGASVCIKGTTTGTVTDIDGNYTLKLPADTKEVTISYIGYATVTVPLKAESVYNISLKSTTQQMEAVVITTGFQTISKERSTGATTTISSKDLKKNINFNMTQTLEGRAAGLNTFSGAPVIRGTTSLLSNAQPLVVVDGLPIEGGVNSINPNDVESVTVLKDAASASIYGTRAANGIIVITTKTASKGKTTYDLSYSLSITPQKRAKDLHFASTSDIIDYERSYLENNPTYLSYANKEDYFKSLDDKQTPYSQVYGLYRQLAEGLITKDQLESGIAELKKNDIRKDYEKYIWRDNVKQQVNLSIRKGSESSNVSLSATYEKQKYGTVGSDYNAMNLNFKNKLNLNKSINLTYGFMANFSKTKSGLGVLDIYKYKPYSKIYNADGSKAETIFINDGLNKKLSDEGLYTLGYNPLDELNKSYSNYSSIQLRAFAELEARVFKGLKYNLKAQYQRGEVKNQSTYTKDSYTMRNLIDSYAQVGVDGTITYNVPNEGMLSSSISQGDNYTVRNQLDYKFNPVDNLTFEMFGGTEFREFHTKGMQNTLYGYNPENQLSGEGLNWTLIQGGVMGALDAFKPARMSYSDKSLDVLNREFSLYSNASLSYQGKYIIAGSWRVDKTNLFGVDSKYKNRPLWSASASWNVTAEDFMQHVKWLNFLKLRASLGANGNVDRSSSPYMLATRSKSTDFGTNYTVISSPPNKSLRWEKTKIFNAGVDFSMFDRRVNGSVEVYHKYTSDLITNSILDYSTGFTSAMLNNGEMKNQGVEVSLGYNWYKSDDWDFETHGVFAYNKNTIEKVNFEATTALDMINYPTSFFRVGDSFNTLYAYRYAGLTASGDPSVYDAKGNVVENSNSMTDPKALVNMGSLIPNVNGALTQTVRYKNFVLEALLVYYGGNKLRLDVTNLYEAPTADMSADILKRWTSTNTNTNIPRFPVYSAIGDRNNFWRYADVNVVSGAMVKLRNISLAYNLGDRYRKMLHLQGCQVRAQVNNLWMWSAAGHGIDPESYDAASGTRYGVNRPTYLLGVNLTF